MLGIVNPSVTRMSTGSVSRSVSVMIGPSRRRPRRGPYQWAAGGPRLGGRGRRSYAGVIELDGPSPAAVAALAPHGVLRAAINLSNFLLVTGRDPDGSPTGVSPDMARELARHLGVAVELIGYKTPGELADDAVADAWDIGNIGAEPARAEAIAFTAAYCEIECTYLVPPDSPLTSIDEVDRPGVRIASAPRAAYDLWLERNIRHAELVRSPGLDGSFELFVEQRLDALAGLRPALLNQAQRLPGSRVLDGQFSSVQQAMGTPRVATAPGSTTSGRSSRRRRPPGSSPTASPLTVSSGSPSHRPPRPDRSARLPRRWRRGPRRRGRG